MSSRLPFLSRRAWVLLALIVLGIAWGVARWNVVSLSPAKWIPDEAELASISPAAQVAAIVLGTLISEDITCLFVGMMIRKGIVSPAVGGVACFIGIYCGDLLLFFIGRWLGPRLLRMQFFSRGFGEKKLREFGRWFERRPWAALAMCRLAPGLRLPLFLSVGALTTSTRQFFWWTCFFAFIWTPAIIGAVVLMGDAFTAPFEYFLGRGWIAILLGVLAMYVVVRALMLLSTADGRGKLAQKLGLSRRQAPQDADAAVTSNDRSAA